MSNSPIQPTGPLNIETRQTDTVANASVGKFQDRVVANRNKAIIKYLSIISGSFALGQSLARICRSVGQRIYAFVKQHFGGTSKATLVMQPQIEMSPVRPSQQYTLIDVPGDGHCGIYAVLVGMGKINLSECIRPKHSDYGGRPIATDEQKKIMEDLRKSAEKKALEAVSTHLSAAGCAERLGGTTLETTDFQYVAKAIGRPIVVSQYQGNVEVCRTICDPEEAESISLFQGNFNNQQLQQGDPIRLYFDGGHYQLMQPK